MDEVAVTLPLELLCPGCENVGIEMRMEMPARLTRNGGIGGPEPVTPIDVPTRLSCPTCGRSVSYGPLKADVTDAAEVPDNEPTPDTGGS
jgi:hypothetical protein